MLGFAAYPCSFALGFGQLIHAHLLLGFAARIHAHLPLEPSFVCILKMSRVGRSGDSRLVTCLEAAELALVPVKPCSKCDYYLANKALNAKASSIP